MISRAVYRDQNGRIWWINESHPNTDAVFAVARHVENGWRTHTAIVDRRELTEIPYDTSGWFR
jgi:hypothetical protein